MQQERRNFLRGYSIWKPRDSGNGSAVQLAPSFEKQAMYLKMAPQVGTDRRFDWKEGAIVAKLGEADIGELLATLRGRQPKADLYHKSPKGVTVVKLDPVKTDKFSGFSMWMKKGEGEGAKELKIFFSQGQAVLLDESLAQGFRLALGWQNAETQAVTADVGGRDVPAEVGSTEDVPF